MINAADFLQTVYNEAVDTQRTPIPVGEYVGQIGPLSDKSIASGTSKDGKPWTRLDLDITIPDPSGSIKAVTGRDPVVTRAGVMLDVTADNKLDCSTGKNLRLFKVFAAAGWPTNDKNQLNPGWNFGFLAGKSIKVKIAHRPNEKDPTAQPYEDVDAITKV